MTMNSALQAYKASQQLNQNPRDILANVHSELYRAIASAKAAHEQKKLDAMCDHIVRSVRILTALVTTLNFSAVGRDGEMLKSFYQRLLKLVNCSDRDGNAAKSYDAAVKLLHPLCKEFRNQSDGQP